MKKNCVLTMWLVITMAFGVAYGYNPALDPSLIGYWEFNEGEGQVVGDSSGNGHDGTIKEGAIWVEGIYGNALSLQGGLVEIPAIDMELSEITMAGWIKPNGSQPDWSALMFMRGVASGFNINGLQLMYHWADGVDSWSWSSNVNMNDGEWNFITLTISPHEAVFYLDGTNRATNPSSHAPVNWDAPIFLGGDGSGDNWATRRFSDAALDDVSLFSRALTASEIADLMTGWSNPIMASKPCPENEETDVCRDVVLSWKPSESAVTHNLYWGEDLDAVSNATGSTVAGLDVNSYDVGRVEFGSRYFWRVDEVNGAPDYSVFKGNIWAFEVEPYSMPIVGSTIVVTASSSTDDSSLPTNTVNGSGFDPDTGSHSVSPDTMWFSANDDLSPWIQYEFDGVKKLDTMKVWNSNSTSESFIGYGVQGVLIEYSVDGETWSEFVDVNTFAQAPGASGYDQYDEVVLGGVAARMVRLTIQTNYSLFVKSVGLSEVQFSAIPAAARSPKPASGSVGIAPDAMLSWRAGRGADQSVVYFGTDADQVADGMASSVVVSTNSIDLDSFDVQMGQTYYWRVDEANDAEAVSVWRGPVWSFSVASELVVDDFESYNNVSPGRPFQTWLDGYGYSADDFYPAGYSGNGTGAAIGHDIWNASSAHYNGSVMERVNTISGSSQAMPFYYSNADGVASHIDRLFTVPQDWTLGGAQTLSIAFYGQIGNTGTLYAQVNDTKRVYPHAATNMALSIWQVWNIDLSSLDVQSVTEFQIGVDGSGASGMLLIDDIQLYSTAGELLTPQDPGHNGLVASYTFENNANDVSGQGNHGTLNGTPAFAAGVVGLAIDCDGVDDYVSTGKIASELGIEGNHPRTISSWVYARGFNNGGIYDIGARATNQDFCIRTQSSAENSWLVQYWGDDIAFNFNSLERWVHFTHVYDGVNTRIYANGMLIVDVPVSLNTTDDNPFQIGQFGWPGNCFDGLIDDVRVYNRALSAEESLWLAGITQTMDRPFSF